MTTQDLLNPSEAEAAELEGVLPMPEDLIPLREEKVLLDKEIELLTARIKEIKEIFGQRLKEDGVQGYVLHGHVRGREVVQNRTNIDGRKLREKFPHIWAQVVKTIRVEYTKIS